MANLYRYPAANSSVQSVLWECSTIALCRFRCPTDHVRWKQENVIRDGFNVGFPRATVKIAQSGHQTFIVDPNRTVFYNQGVAYRRSQISKNGDSANVMLFDAQTIADAIAPFDSQVLGRPERLFAFTSGPLTIDAYRAQRMLFACVSAMDDFEAEERALRILGRVVEDVFRERGCQSTDRKRSRISLWREQIDAAKHLMGRRFASRLLLPELAAEAGTSIFHLCRIFQRLEGMTVHRYLTRLRIRFAVDLLLDRQLPAANVALSTGFCSQSHLIRAFRREFGLTPRRMCNAAG